jgi:hypothetical protein
MCQDMVVEVGIGLTGVKHHAITIEYNCRNVHNHRNVSPLRPIFNDYLQKHTFCVSLGATRESSKPNERIATEATLNAGHRENS